MRPSWDTYFLLQATATAMRATCARKHVGALIVDPQHRIVSGGYNGSPSGMPHCDDVGHELKNIDGRKSCIRTLHAESNALDRAGANARGCTLYVTVTPCYECAKRAVNAGIQRIVYAEFYQSQSTELVKGFLADAGVELLHLPHRFEIRVLCAHASCSNEARYGLFCGLHDLADDGGRGTRFDRT